MKESRRMTKVQPFLIIFLLMFALGSGATVMASQEGAVVDTSVSYNEEKNLAKIQFDVVGVDSKTYEINSIKSESDQTIVYERGGNAETVNYEVDKNGDFAFLVEYKNCISGKTEELRIEIGIDEIQEKEPESVMLEPSRENEAIKANAAVANPFTIELHGQVSTWKTIGISKETTLKTRLTLDPATFKIKCYLEDVMIKVPLLYHEYFGDDTYYTISVIKKGTPLTQVNEESKKTKLMEVKGRDTVVPSNFTKIEEYKFAEGDMIEIICPEGKFRLGDNEVENPMTEIVGTEKGDNSVYELTATGFKEVYNEKPTISGNETPLYGKYNQATWGTMAGQEEILHPFYYGIEFKDDRDLAGGYVAGGFKITKKEGKTTFGVTNGPGSNTTPGVWEASYDVTDAWGRKGDTKTRQIVQLPNIDEKISIEEMVPKMNEGKVVPGFVDFSGASINTGSKTVTLASGIVINADTSKPMVDVVHNNGKSTKFINKTDGSFSEVQLPDNSKVEADEIERAHILKDKSIKIFYNDKKTQQKLVIHISATGEMTKAKAYPQSMTLNGLAYGGKYEKSKLILDTTTFKIKSGDVRVGTKYHYYFSVPYYTIFAIKKGTPLTQVNEVNKKDKLMEVLGTDNVALDDYKKIEEYNFAEGDMIQILCPEGKFRLGDSDSEGENPLAGVVGAEKGNNSVYEVTANGFKEIYNEKPTISGNETPLYGKYNQATWGTIAGQEEILHPYYNGIEFKDDRDMAGEYVAGGFKITKKDGKTTFGVTNGPGSNTTPGVWEAKYDVTDAWGREGDTKTRQIVQLPNIDEKISIEEMVPKMNEGKAVPGFVDFSGASINTGSKTVTLVSGVVINADTSKPMADVVYNSGKSTKFINKTDGTFSEVQLPDNSKVEADEIEKAQILKDKSIKIFYNDKKTQQKLVISITAIGEITKSPAYPQSIQLCGTSGKVDNKKALLMIDPGNYKITCKMNAPGEGYHWNYGNDCYYRISVIKNGTSLAQLDDPQNKTELLSVKASDMVKAEDYAAIEKYDFAEGDMIEIICPGSAFYMPGEPIIGSDGVSKVDYTKWCGNDEKAHHAVYKLTAKGLQEIYNEKPTISGNETPLYGKYNQATWGTIAGQEEILHPYYYDIEFKDDRNLAGDYVAGGFKITKKEGKTTFGVINVPESNTTPGVWEAKYDVTDAWGRVGDTKTRQIVQLPNIDGKISIEEMVPKMNEGKVVPGFVDFPDAVVNSDLKTVTLPSQIVINADLKLSPICIKYENETTTEFKNNANGAFEVVALPDGGKIGADQISAVTIKADKSVSIATKYRNAQNIEVSLTISSEGVVNYPLGVSVEYARFKNGEGYIDIPSTYDGSVDKYIRSGKEAELELKYVNLIPTGVDITGQFKVNDLKIGDTWCDITSVLVRGQDYSDQLPEKGNGQTIAERTFTGVIPGDSNTSCNINLKVIIPESVSLDITQALDQKLPLLTFIASFEGGNIIGNTTLTQTMAVITHPIAKGKNLVWNDMDTSLPAGYAKDNLGLARCYDDVNFHRLSESSTASGLKCIEEKYRVYNFATQKWADSSQHDFEALNNGMAVYGYEFTVKDSRREKQIAEEEDALKTTAYGKLFVAEFVTHSTDESTFILTNDITLNLSETQIAYLGEQGVKNEIKKQLEVKGIIDKGGESLELADVTVDCSTLDYSNPVPKTYMCSLSLGSGDSEADQSFLLRVQKNSWSYNTKDRTEENGASGFIVIPKSIELKRSEPGMLAATDEIFFANYQNATDVVYNLSVDKTFNLVKESDVTNQVEVNTSADGSTEQTDNKLSIGEIRNTNGQGNGKIINFSASSTQADYSKGRWTGNVTFYLDRN